MKRFIESTILLIILVGMTKVVSAQAVNSGAWMLGGSLGFNSIKYDGADEANTAFNISPNFGYYVINDLAIGVRLSFYNESYGDESDSQFGAGPWARYYIVKSPVFAQAGIDFGSTGLDLFSLLADEGSSTIHFGAGYSWFLNNSVAIEPLLQYSIYSADDEGFIGDYNRFGFNLSVQAFIGRNPTTE
jgi:hypothetical protein